MSYDIIVIGAGQAGIQAAQRSAKHGFKTVLIESDLVGGECHYWGCVPSKALLRSGHVYRAALAVKGAAETITRPISTDKVFEKRNVLTDWWDDTGIVKKLAAAGGFEILKANAEIVGIKSVRLTDKDGKRQDIKAKEAVILATGTLAAIPKIKGIESIKYWDNKGATSSQHVPDSLLIIGGGPIGCEMATTWATFGGKVILAVRGRLLEQMEPFAGDMVKEALEELGVEVRLGITPVSTGMKGDDVYVEFSDGTTISASEVLFATGKTPITDVGLESVGLKPDGFLKVDDTLLITHETNKDEPWLYAVGDVNGRNMVQHQGRYQARVASDAILARSKQLPLSTKPFVPYIAIADHSLVPQVVFTDPEVAFIGLTEAAALKKGYKVKAVEFDMAKLSGAVLRQDGYKGHAKMVVDVDKEVIVGMTIVGPEVADLIHSATIAIVAEVPLGKLWHAVASFPTVSEVWLRLLEAYGL